MPQPLESKKLIKLSEPFYEYSASLEQMFPKLEWDLKRAGYTIDAVQYLSIVLYVTLSVFVACMIILVVPMAATAGLSESYLGIGVSIFVTAATCAYAMYLPHSKMQVRALLIDRDLEYMLKDMQIQLSSGVPLFSTFINIVRGGYGECSKISEDIIDEVQQGKKMDEVLDQAGMWSPSDYFRRMLWQIVNALKSGNDVSEALDAIALDIRIEKENKIKAYGKELNLYGLIYLMVAIIMPSMGVTLLVILSSFMGSDVINLTLFIAIALLVIVLQVLFISFVKAKRPMI